MVSKAGEGSDGANDREAYLGGGFITWEILNNSDNPRQGITHTEDAVIGCDSHLLRRFLFQICCLRYSDSAGLVAWSVPQKERTWVRRGWFWNIRRDST